MQQPQPQEKTNVNHEQVNSEPTAQSDPYDDALAFKSLLTAVHGEFNHMVNENRYLRSSSNLFKNFQHKILIGRRERIK